jgi:hypothetical protein
LSLEIILSKYTSSSSFLASFSSGVEEPEVKVEVEAEVELLEELLLRVKGKKPLASNLGVLSLG